MLINYKVQLFDIKIGIYWMSTISHWVLLTKKITISHWVLVLVPSVLGLMGCVSGCGAICMGLHGLVLVMLFWACSLLLMYLDPCSAVNIVFILLGFLQFTSIRHRLRIDQLQHVDLKGGHFEWSDA